MKNSGGKRSGGLFLAKVFSCIVCIICFSGVVFGEDIYARFAAVPDSGPAPLNVTFVDQSEGNPTYYRWDLDGNGTWDPDASDNRNPSHTYTTPGMYDVCMTVWNGTLVTSNSTGTIRVYESVKGNLSANFAASPRSGYPPLNVSFIDQSSSALNWTWIFDINSSSTLDSEMHLQNPVHTYTNPGWYTVMLNVSDNYSADKGRLSSLSQENFIHVLPIPKPQPDFVASPQSGTSNLTVTFTDLTPITSEFFGNLSPDLWQYSYDWDFGDDSLNSSEKNPVHTYTKKGLFNVSVGVTGPGGMTLISKNGYIAVDTPPAPLADFTVSPSNGTVPLTVNFIGLAEGTGHLTYLWNFGDNSTIVSGRNPVHVYSNPGSYNVSLEVSDGSKTGSVIRNNSVIAREPAPLSAMFTATPRNGTAPLQVSFIDQSYSETPLTYNWSFGDGSLINHDKNPVHIYTQEGVYGVSLQVKGGNTSNVINQSNFITVEKPALHKADFTAVPVEGPVPLIVSFVDQSTGTGPFTYLWDFGDGSGQVTDKNPSHTYEIPGLYTVNETVNSSAGSILVSKERLVNATTAIESRPVYANFSAISTRGVAPFNVQFMDLSSGPVAAWKWTFGDGSSVTEQGPNHTYVKPGVYDVSLDVFNKSGVSNTITSSKFITALSPAVTTKITLVYADLSNKKKIQFFDNSEGVGINSWIWDFGDGSDESEIQNPFHEFATSGTFPIKLTISNGYASDSNTFYVKIK
ncbi:PKD domain-containing protein [Methanospirillum lacunae]|uniref:PKD domain-containing protein n=1 Tax=Methanospirillum lacunae TaxID=668570 RepID=A0A2V2MXV8_9EURY|nr:PKD domain-containing protein [Methanospirillum lacunae]PWR72974.1 hypothetical protein DK846_05710 [Methanospirillum lacunae]